MFKRFSAYDHDNRIRDDRSLRDGTYATTEEGAKNVKTGKDAVARYALPNPQPASYRFTIKPEKDTVIQTGVVESAYEQPGGGVEVRINVMARCVMSMPIQRRFSTDCQLATFSGRMVLAKQ